MFKIQAAVKQLLCKHYDAELVRWHWTHGVNGCDPRTVEAEYRCKECEKLLYMNLDCKESGEWATVMGNYKIG